MLFGSMIAGSIWPKEIILKCQSLKAKELMALSHRELSPVRPCLKAKAVDLNVQ